MYNRDFYLGKENWDENWATYSVPIPQWGETLSFSQVTCDELHAGPPYRTGGPFDSRVSSFDGMVPKNHCDVTATVLTPPIPYMKYVGGFTTNTYLPNYLNLVEYDDVVTNIESYGATGWTRFRPTRSSADLTVFLAELKDFPRMLKTTARGFHNMWRQMGGSRTGFGPKSVANHWLNTQFGWLPFLNDLRKFYETTQSLDRRIAQLRRDNGQWVKRSGTILEEEDKELVGDSESSSAHYPLLPSVFFNSTGGTGRYSIVKRSYRRVWFKARFRYYMPWLDRANWYPRAVAYMYGTRISPSVLWEITPWSWLIDWCSNAGDVIQNVTSMMHDNLAAKYAYVMSNALCEVEQTSSLHLKDSVLTTSWTADSEIKLRAVASPFGFGLSSINFSARQWSILSALGLSRLNYR